MFVDTNSDLLQVQILHFGVVGSIQLFFFAETVRQWCTYVKSFCMQFEKRGCGCLVLGSKELDNLYRSWKTEVKIGVLLVINFFFTPSLSANKAHPSLWKDSHRNPRPHFSNCMQNDITSVRRCLTSFRKKKPIEYYWC